MLIYNLFCFVYPNCIVFNIQDNRFVINVSRCLLCDILYVAASSRTSPMFSDNAYIYAFVLQWFYFAVVSKMGFVSL